MREMGYGLQLLHVPRVVRLCDHEDGITATYSDSGIPYVGLSDILHLSNISRDSVHLSDEVLLSDQVNCDPLELLHLRFGHVSKSKLLEAHRHILFTGSGLSRKHLSERFTKSVSGHLCISCAKTKITRRSFYSTDQIRHGC